ncbi:MAG: hypothetical protein IPK59_14495 [Rhodospirillaceae bacterium]|nr:hypothetical protein [Rhodospirillaceae bacterium]
MFAPQEANPDYMEDVLKAMRLELDWGPAAETTVPFHVAVDNLNVEMTQSLLGGTVAAARVIRGMPLDRMKAIGRLLLDARLNLPAKALVTALNIDRALDGPVELPDIFEDTQDSVQTSSPSEPQALETSKTSSGPKLKTMSMRQFRESLINFDEVTIQIGDVVLVQHPHTTATDQIIIEAIIDVASSRGCDPEPDPTSPREDGKSIYGGTKGSQSRITDIGQPGHRGSAQPDATTNLSGHGNKGAIYVNTASTKADLITPIVREIASAQQILRNTEKQLAADPRLLKELHRAINRPGHVWVYGKKWGWELDKIRRHVRRKVEQLYDQLYKDCLPVGEPDIFPLDDPNDPEFRE